MHTTIIIKELGLHRQTMAVWWVAKGKHQLEARRENPNGVDIIPWSRELEQLYRVVLAYRKPFLIDYIPDSTSTEVLAELTALCKKEGLL